MMSTMTSTPTRRTVAKAGPPDTFVELVGALYGDAVDPDAVWGDVIKLSPDQADVNATSSGDRTKRRITAGLSAIGATAGAAGLGYAGYKTGQAYRAAPKTLSRTRRLGQAVAHEKLGAALIPLEVAGLGGEVMATRILHNDTKKPKLVPTGAQAVDKGLASVLGFAERGTKYAGRHTVQAVAARPASEAAAGVKSRAGYAGRHRPPAGTQATAPAAASKPAATSAPVRPATMLGGSPTLKPTGNTLPTGGVKSTVARPTPTPQPASGSKRTPGTDALNTLGRDAAVIAGTPTGKVLLGAAGALGGAKVLGSAKSSDSYGSYYKRDDSVEFTGEFSKFDDAKRQAFGWASVVSKNGTPVVDRQGDYISAEDLEQAAYNYVHSSRVGGDMHKRGDDGSPHKVSDMIESIVFTDDKVAKMGLPDDFPRGWWVGFKIHDEPTWDLVRKQGRTGFSIHGRGLRNDVDEDSLMGYTQ